MTKARKVLYTSLIYSKCPVNTTYAMMVKGRLRGREKNGKRRKEGEGLALE
jgi:hypothetical protein